MAIIVKLNTSIKYQGTVSFNRKMIYDNYMKKSFVFDMFGIIGLIWNYISNENNLHTCLIECTIFLKYWSVGDTYERLE